MIKEVDDERKAKGFTIPLLAKSEEDEVAASKVQIATKTVDHQQVPPLLTAFLCDLADFRFSIASISKPSWPPAPSLAISINHLLKRKLPKQRQ